MTRNAFIADVDTDEIGAIEEGMKSRDDAHGKDYNAEIIKMIQERMEIGKR